MILYIIMSIIMITIVTGFTIFLSVSEYNFNFKIFPDKKFHKPFKNYLIKIVIITFIISCLIFSIFPLWSK